jgi:hypothetical protein
MSNALMRNNEGKRSLTSTVSLQGRPLLAVVRITVDNILRSATAKACLSTIGVLHSYDVHQ